MRIYVGNCTLVDHRDPLVAGCFTSVKPARKANSFIARDSLR